MVGSILTDWSCGVVLEVLLRWCLMHGLHVYCISISPHVGRWAPFRPASRRARLLAPCPSRPLGMVGAGADGASQATEAQNRRAEEAAHEDMVQQLKIRYSRSHSHTGGMVIIGDRRGSSKSSASANHDFRSPSPERHRSLSSDLGEASGERSWGGGRYSSSESPMKMDGAAALAAELNARNRSRISRIKKLAESFSGWFGPLLLGNRTARRGHLVFYHKSASRRAVHVLTLLCCAYSAFTVPFRFAFDTSDFEVADALGTLDAIVRFIRITLTQQPSQTPSYTHPSHPSTTYTGACDLHARFRPQLRHNLPRLSHRRDRLEAILSHWTLFTIAVGHPRPPRRLPSPPGPRDGHEREAGHAPPRRLHHIHQVPQSAGPRERSQHHRA